MVNDFLAGAIVMGAAGSQPPSVLLITRNGHIYAAGTRSRPIIMTSARSAQGS